MKERIIKELKQNKYLCGVLFVLVFFVLLHLSFVGLFSDDLWFLGMINEAESLPALLAERYQTWTGRLILEAVCFTLVKLPFSVWCVIDVLMCLLLYHSLTGIFINDHNSSGNLVMGVMMACYPFMHMASAGWISTSLNYLWPFALISYVIYVMIRAISGAGIRKAEYVFSVVAFIYAANSELCAEFAILCIIGCMIYKAGSHSKLKLLSKYEAVILLMALVEIAFAFMAPGNALRLETEVRWMPEFNELSLFRKGMLCGIFVFEHFVAIPDVIFFFFTLLIVLCGLCEKRRLWEKLILITPLMTDIVFSLFYLIKDFIIGGKREYDYSYPTVYPVDNFEKILQITEFAGLILVVTATVVSMILIFNNGFKKRFIAVWFLGSAFAVRMSLMLSATMFSSWHRTLIYMYFAMICVSCMMLEMQKERIRKVPWMRLLCLFTMLFGMAVNVILTVGHQIRRR